MRYGIFDGDFSSTKKEHGLARPIILSNGKLHVGINLYAEVHDFYYPYVGHENHAAAKNLRHKIGVYCDGRLSWLDDGSWDMQFSYHKHSLISHITATSESMGVMLEFDDFIDAFQDVFIRNIHIINSHDQQREIKLFMHQVFDIADRAGNGDTVQYLPESKGILTYRGDRAFVIGGNHAQSGSFDQHSLGLFAIEGHEGTYKDAEDGILANNTVEHGRVDSTIGFTMDMKPHGSKRVHYWITAARSTHEAIALHDGIQDKKNTVQRLLATNAWWADWLKPALATAEHIPEEFRDSFITSILLIKSHISHNGAVIASTDSTLLKQWRDAYAYCWPRDAAYAIWPLIRIGYRDEALSVFRFFAPLLHEKGYIAHKFQADGALGASWHGYVHKRGITTPPIQEDETASLLFVFTQFYHACRNDQHYSGQLLAEFYKPFVKKMADFLTGYIDEKTGLPLPSYDLWEEQFFVSTYTIAIVYRALLAAADIADISGDSESAVRWRTAAEDIQQKAKQHLYSTERKAFIKGLTVDGETVSYNDVVDSAAMYGIFMYGLYDIDSLEVVTAMETTYTALSVKNSDVIGVARYENDHYLRIYTDITGNPWFITSLWRAQYLLETGKTDEALSIIRWCHRSMLSTCVLSEQVDAYTGSQLSVAPLTWSQAEYVSTLLDLAHED
jgi:GH15 family glucan-1,4-alpha-glucosidase